MKRLIFVVALAGLVTLGSVGVAAAQSTGGSTSPSTPAPNTATNRNGRLGGQAVAVLRVSAQTLGVTPKDLAASLCGGQTLSQVASAHGQSAQTLINAIVKAADQRISKARRRGASRPARPRSAPAR